jgi:hypothetical protein
MKNMVVLKTFWRCILHSLGKESQLHLQKKKVWVRVRSVQSTKKNVGQIVHLIKAGPRDVLGWNRERILTIHVSINLCTDSQACHMSKKSRVGRSGLIFFYFIFLLSTKPEIVVPGSGIRFRYLIFENSGKMTNYAVFLPSLLSISTKS